MQKIIKYILLFGIMLLPGAQIMAQSWAADNGNGTFTNPIFYEEVSDPDIIRVDDWFYLASTSMHSMPGLNVFRSRDLVNWEFLSYTFDRLDMGSEFRLENGREAYGQGIWAPCIRYNKGAFYIFSNVNNHGMQVFTAQNPAGPWEHHNLGGHIYDLSVLFDDDGKIYAVHGYDEVKLIEIKPDFSGYIENSERIIIARGNAMGEGHHFYKIGGKYFIISANFSPVGRKQCARADNVEGPYETRVISVKETYGMELGHLVGNVAIGTKVPKPGFKFNTFKSPPKRLGAAPIHQGGIVDLPNGEWWGFSMMDYRSIGRTTCISPVTWVDGWPYFGLLGNLGRSPKTWYKPNVGVETEPQPPFERNDDFNGKKLNVVWQWNHEPYNKKWSLNKQKGALRIHTMPAEHFLWAKNMLTQRGIGPESYATVTLDVSKLKPGDIAGLGLLNMPYAWIGVVRNSQGYTLRWYDQLNNKTIDNPLTSTKIHLRAFGNFDTDWAQLSYSMDGETFENVGDSILMPYQLKTFQGTRYALFAYNEQEVEGGYVDFEKFTIEEPLADRSRNLPIGKVITLINLSNNTQVWASPHGMLNTSRSDSNTFNKSSCRFRVHDRGQGRISLEATDGSGFVTVVGIGLSADVRIMKKETENSLFMWQDMLHGECMLLSFVTNRYVGLDPDTGESYSADWAGTVPGRKDGTVFFWKEVGTSKK